MPRKKEKQISFNPSNNEAFRRKVRVMRMVLELHKSGYQGLRIITGISPSGFYWRCAVSFASNISEDYNYDGKGNYQWKKFFNPNLVARYSSAQGNNYFGWRDS